MFRRERPIGRLRLRTPPDAPSGSPRDALVVEFAGQVGHPSSYGMLGGHTTAAETTFDVPLNGLFYPDSMAASEDRATFGLPLEYRWAVLEAMPTGLVVTVAAHGAVSSSEAIFARLTHLLGALLQSPLPATDDELWAALDVETRHRE